MIVITALVAVIHRCAGVERISLRSAQCLDTVSVHAMDCRNKSGNDNNILFGSDQTIFRLELLEVLLEQTKQLGSRCIISVRV